MTRALRPIFSLALVAVLAGLSFSGRSRVAQAAPEPGVVPTTWELTFKNYAPERIVAAVEGKGEKQTYWYMRYTVTNNSGQDLLFTPEFELMTDTGQIVKAGKGVDDSIFRQIKELYKNPLMEGPVDILGKILQGEDNAKDGVAIFAGVDADARTFRFMVGGISGETSPVLDPVTKEKVVLHKTLVLEYLIPGESIGAAPQPQFKSKKWVMK